MDYLTENWLLVLIALLAAITVGWYVFHASRRTRITSQSRDVLDENAAPAARNQALIDTPPAVARDIPLPPAAPAGMAGAGEAVSAVVEEAQIQAVEAEGMGLDRLKGVGPKLVAQLAGMGVSRLDQVAAWNEADIDRIDAQLGRFQGRIRRDAWVEQARLLTAGDTAGYAARFGNLN